MRTARKQMWVVWPEAKRTLANTRPVAVAFAALLAVCLFQHSIFAQAEDVDPAPNAIGTSWTGSSSTAWGVNANWNPGTMPTSTGYGIFDSTFTNQPTLITNRQTGGILMTGSVPQNVTISGANTLTIQGNTSINGSPAIYGILINNTSLSTLTISLPVTLGNGQTWTNNSGNLFTVSGTVAKKDLTINGTGNTTISGVIGGSGTLLKDGSGTLTLTAVNNLSGNSIVVSGGTLIAAAGSGAALGTSHEITVNSGGTLLLGANDQIKNKVPMTLNGGTFDKGNFSEGNLIADGIGALTLTANSHVNFGTGTVGGITFGSFTAGVFTLAIDNWTGTPNTVGITGSTDRLIFSATQAGNLGSFAFTGYAGATQFDLGGGFFEVVPLAPVPEPSTWIGGGLAAGVMGFMIIRRQRRGRCTYRPVNPGS